MVNANFKLRTRVEKGLPLVSALFFEKKYFFALVYMIAVSVPINFCFCVLPVNAIGLNGPIGATDCASEFNAPVIMGDVVFTML